MMPEHWKSLVEHLPFVCAARNYVKPDWSAITQGLIIAAVTSIGASYITTARLEERLAFQVQLLTNIEQRNMVRETDEKAQSKEIVDIRERITRAEARAK